MTVSELLVKARLEKDQIATVHVMSMGEIFKTAPGTVVFGIDSDIVEKIIRQDVVHYRISSEGISILA